MSAVFSSYPVRLYFHSNKTSRIGTKDYSKQIFSHSSTGWCTAMRKELKKIKHLKTKSSILEHYLLIQFLFFNSTYSILNWELRASFCKIFLPAAHLKGLNFLPYKNFYLFYLRTKTTSGYKNIMVEPRTFVAFHSLKQFYQFTTADPLLFFN